MTTHFEVLIGGGDELYARQAADAVVAEISRLEGLLSRHEASSDVAQINRLRPGNSIRVSPDVFDCLSMAAWAFEQTGGAFDVTVAPCLDLRRRDTQGTPPLPAEIERARQRLGMSRLELDSSVFAVGIRADAAESVAVDLGGIGKGFALDKAADILDEWDLANYLLVAGGSTVLAAGPGTDGGGWSVGVGSRWGKAAGVERVRLHDLSLSGSGTEVKGMHIIDPATGAPAEAHLAAWAACPSATLSDALSTAFMVMSTERVRALCAAHGNIGAYVVETDGRWVAIPARTEPRD